MDTSTQVSSSRRFVGGLVRVGLIALAIALVGGWIGSAISVAQLVIVSPSSIVTVILSTFFWFGLLPPILWAVSFFYLRQRRLIGWRLFVLGTALSLIAALLRPSLLSILFSAIILYFTLQCYDEFYAR